MGNLTDSQKSIWVTEQYYRGSSINNICGTAIIDEKVDFEKLEKSIEIVCQKHDNFWLKLTIENGEVKQELSESRKTQIDIINVANSEELEQERNKIVRIPFKLENSKLFKFYIFKFANGQGAFMLNIHHLIADAWTLAFICNEIIKTYSALKQNQEIEKKAIYSYMDYIKSEQEYLESEKYQRDKTYWEEQFATIPEVAMIPGSKENTDEANPTGERKQFQLDAKDVEKIKEYSKQNKISLYNFFMAIYAIYIGEISNLDEFVIGTPIINRTNFKEKNAAGMFINMAPFKINMSQDIDFKTFIRNIATDSMDMLKHQKYSYQCLLEDLRDKDKNIPNLYNILLSYQITNAQMSGGDVKYKTDWTFNGCCADDIDIQIYDLNDTGSLNIAYDYKTSVYEEKDIKKLHKRILNIIKQVTSQDEIQIKDIEIVTPEEKEKLVTEFNRTELEYDYNIPIIKYFEEQAEETPESIAIVFEKQKMSYRELNEKANSLAYELRKNGVTNNTIVGIMQERSFEMMIAILAVLKSGGCYIPIAPDYPNERIEYMLKDSNASILLTSENSRIQTEKKVINIELKNNEIYDKHRENLENISKPEDLSYLIYTSGSTGTPKGVMLKQQNLSNFYNSMKETIDYLKDGKQHKILSITTVSFDIFAFETLMSLTRGLTVYMTNENEQKMTSELERIIKENQVEIMQTTPSIMKFHLENVRNKEDLQSLRYIMLAGEPLPKLLADKIKNMIPGVTIYNGYGPSETTIFSTTANVTEQSKITIGRPVHNTQIYILNKNKKLMPQGMIGEIYISGDGVGKGYMNKDEQTKASFLPNPFDTGKIMYKVGDLGAFDENGEITCYGRVDNQVKIRGLRIELPEIEKQMLSVYNISDCVVVKKQLNGKDALCAYYVENGPVDKNALKTVLHTKLPQYMVPQYFVKLEKMPHTPNGKIDKKALPEPNLEEVERIIVKSRNEIDAELIKIIEKMLHIEQVSIEDTLLNLGGDSLTAITLSTKILSKFNVQINIKDILSNYTIKDMSDYIRQSQSDNVAKIKIEKSPEQETYPLSSAQKRIYYNARMIGEDNIVYNIPGGILVDEVLDKEKVKSIFEKIIERHSSLRTTFILDNDNIVQKISEKIELEIPIYNNTETEIQEILKHFSKPFDLEGEILFRAELHYIDNNKTLLLIESHHIVMDGTSLNNLIIEFERLYNGENLKRIPIQYKDYAVWENKFNESEAVKKAENYWVNKFKDSEFSQLNLPYDYKMSANMSYKGNKITKVIDEKQFRKIERYAKKIGVSPYMLFISAFFILLYKYTGQEEIILGSPFANRNINETKRMIGMFVNNIVVKGNINSDETFQEFVNGIKEQILDDLSNQPYPFDMLVKKLGIKGDNSRNPLFDVMFTYQNKEENSVKLNEKEVQVIEINNNISKFNLSMEIKPKTHTINIEYCTELFKKQTIERLFEHYMNAINSIMADSNVKIKDIEIISEEEKKKILYEFNDTQMDYPRNKTVAQLFEEQVEKTPDNIAVVFEDEKLTYRELNEKSNQLANYLIDVDIDKNDIISIKLNRSFDLIIAILAVLKSGAAYMLIDPDLPVERIRYMIENAKSNLLITTSDLYIENHIESLKIDKFKYGKYSKNRICNVEQTDKLCVLYTSGSTGKPKGVLLNKKGFTNLMYAFKKDMNTSEYRNILGIATVSFDMFAVELYTALTFGNTLILANEEQQKNVAAMRKLIKNYNVEFLVTTPSRIELLLIDEYENSLRQLKCMQLGGEKISKTLLNKIKKFTEAKIYNGYGPTETSACCTNKLLTDENITIGKPLSNVQVYIYNTDMELCPIGITGEICIGGDGVSDGYINNPEITNKVFVKSPQNNNQIIYKTGDIGKFNEKGEIEYIGRKDDQIKIRGLRVELPEIEARLNDITEINQSTVLCMKDANMSYLIAFVTAKDTINVHKIKLELAKTLPAYMIPRYIIHKEKLPITINGKVDRKALEKSIEQKNLTLSTNLYVPPENQKQKIFCDIWSELLKTNVGIDDDLFDIGADSLLAINFKTQLLSYNIDLPYANIFKYRNIRAICDEENRDNKINSSLAEYDYTEINKLLESQDANGKEFNDNNNVLLLGNTGFVGMHIVYSFIKNTKGKIYCIVREKKNNLSARERFEELLHFYFGNELDKFIDNRIFVLKGNIVKDRFGLTASDYEMLSENIDVIINSAANVNHYGNIDKFKTINNDLVKQIIEFCLNYKKRLIHISSLSISGNTILDGTTSTNDNILKKDFTEKDLFIGQTLDNVYSRSKFEGEKLILENIVSNHLNAQILRLGNITSRYKDGKFQINFKDNAFANRIKSFMELKEIPNYLLNNYMEFTPVDLCAEAIVDLLNNRQEKMYIYHIYNNNHIYFSELIELLQNLNINIKIVDEGTFSDKVEKILNDKKRASILSGVVNDFDTSKKLSYSSNIKISNEISNLILKDDGFIWPEIDLIYIEKYLNYLQEIKFINYKE